MDILTAAERALLAAGGAVLRLGAHTELAGSDRSRVVRCSVLDGPCRAPASVIVKQTRGMDHPTDSAHPDHSSVGPAWRFRNELAALQFLGEVAEDAGLAPRLLAADQHAGVIVLEDLGAARGLDHLLLGADAAAAERALLAFATALGTLHAHTHGKQEVYARFRTRLGADPAFFSTVAEDVFPPERVAAVFHAAVDAAGITPMPGVDADLAVVVAFWSAPGPFLAYTHSDPCPDNCLLVDTTLRLIDWEFGGFRHALVDGISARMAFPTCWCANRLPEAVLQRMEHVYRTALATGCPEAGDDTLFQRAVVEACAYTTIGMLHWAMPGILDADSAWGLATFRQRLLLRLDGTARAAEEYGHLQALGATCAALAARLRSAWSSETHLLPIYPAFRPACGSLS
jgi:hypothetical protein